MSNIFLSLASWFKSGTEDFFTASLALFLQRNEVFREEFLNWLQPYVLDDLHGRRWTVKAQVTSASDKGDAIIDMEFASPDLLLWFEHKIGAGIGKYEEKDQIEKYLDATNRITRNRGTLLTRWTKWIRERTNRAKRVRRASHAQASKTR